MYALEYLERNPGFIQKYWDTLMNDPYTGQFCRSYQDMLRDVVFKDIRAVMPLLFDSGFMESTDYMLDQVLGKLIYGTVALEMRKCNFNPPRELEAQISEINNIIAAAKQQRGGSGNFGNGGGYRPQGFQNTNISTYNGNNNSTPGNYGAAFTAAPTRFNSNSNCGVQPTISSFAEGQTMNKEDHIPYHLRNQNMNQNAQQQQEVVTEIQPVVVEPPKRKVFTTNIEIMNKLDMIFDNDTNSVSSMVYMNIPESLSKPILLSMKEKKFFPILNPSDEIGTKICGIVASAKNVFELFEQLDGEMKRNQIGPAIEWINKRISHMIEMALRHRYRVSNGLMPNYKKYYRDFHAEMHDKSWYQDLQELIMVHVNEDIGGLELFTGADESLQFIEVTSATQMLTLPWIIRYSYGKNVGWTEEVCDAELNLVMEKAFKLVDKNICSMLVTDLSNTRFRVYPITNLDTDGDTGPRFHWEIFAF